MSFWAHVGELRIRIFRSLGVLLLSTLFAFFNKRLFFDKIILAPKDSDFFTNRMLCKLSNTLCNFQDWLCFKGLCIDNIDISIQNLNLAGQFTTHLYISFSIGAILAMPYFVWEIWNFVKPALYEKEKQHSSGAVLIISLLFLTGVLFSYFLIVPLTINFLGNYKVSPDVKNIISLKSYINTVVSLCLSVGIVFELPIFAYFLSKIGVVSADLMKKGRKVMIVVILILSAIITPPDLISQIMVSIPLIFLYEISIKVAKRIEKKREKENNNE